MTVLTLANQLTLLRMLLIPAFVILVVYGHLGWALTVFVTAGITDALDGLIARRAGQKTSLGAWLDPMADKLLLVTTFVVLTLPNLGLANRLPIWLTVCIISRDVVIVLTVAIVNLAIGPRTFRPSMFGKIATATYIVTAVVAMLFNYLGYAFGRSSTSCVWASLAITHRLEPALHLACVADHRCVTRRARSRARDRSRSQLEMSMRFRRTLRRLRSVGVHRCALLALPCPAWPQPAAQAPPKQAVVDTIAGTFVIDLTPETAPNQAAYFMKQAQAGAYDGTTFHRMVKYGMVQGGDPLTKDPAKRALYGTGGLNAVKAEARAPKMTRGSVAAVLVPGRPDSAGAQFFIVLADQPALDNQYTVFGQVADGMEVLQKISETPVDDEGRGHRARRDPARHDSRYAAAARAVRHRDRRRSWRPTARCSTPAPGRSRSSSSPTRRPNTVRQFMRLAAGRRLQRHGVPPRRAGLRDSDRRASSRAGAADREAAGAGAQPAAGVQRHQAREGDRLDGARRRARQRDDVVLHLSPGRRPRSTASTPRSAASSTAWRRSRRSRRRRGPARRRIRASS